LASLVFYADTRFGSQDRTYVTGSDASIVSIGANEKQQMLTVYLAGGTVTPELKGSWFDDGFAGTMGELLCAIEEGRPSSISARDNLKSLELCFAAVASAEQHSPIEPGSVKTLRE
jgi:predicted dehydrogenase